jgi:hypothetical protein
MELLFTTYEDFLSDQEKLVDRMLEFYGGDRRHFSWDLALSSNENIDYHFRQGEKDEWKRVFEPDVVDALNDCIPTAWFQRFNWKP